MKSHQRQDEGPDHSNEGESSGVEAISGLPPCGTGTPGVDCKKVKPLPICKNNTQPKPGSG